MYYRKYRPQTIAELDNELVRETLGQALLENKWVHAYLLTGTRGSGKTSTARLIAKIVNCTNRRKGEEPCNRCESCKAVTAGSSLDVMEIDAASNTGVDDIRDLREKVKLAPTSSRYKVYIIDEVHMLSTGAFNALLKTLEEPPEHVIFVLATTDPQKLPETIMSRCLVYDFGRISTNEIVRSLKKVIKGEGLSVSDDVIAQIAKKANGSYRDGQKLLEQFIMRSASTDLELIDSLNPDNLEKLSKTLLISLEKRDLAGAVKVVETSFEKGIKMKDLVKELVDDLRGVLLFRNGVLSQQEELGISSEDVNHLITGLLEANQQLRDCPVPQLPLEMVIIEYCTKGSEIKDMSSEPSVEKPDMGKKATGEEKVEEKNSPQTQSSKMSEPAVGESLWPEILAGVKPYNHSIVALLKAGRLKEIARDYLVVEIFYKFHKEKLEEKKNREILEKVVSDIMGKETKVKFVLAEKK